MVLKVRNYCKTCEKFALVTSAIGELLHTELLKLSFLCALKWAIRPVLSDQVTNYTRYMVWESQFHHFVYKNVTLISSYTYMNCLRGANLSIAIVTDSYKIQWYYG